MDKVSKPGMYEALINAVRGFAGLGQQQSPGAPTNLQSSYRQYVEDAAIRGETPMTLRDWQNSQSQMLLWMMLKLC